MNSRTFQFLHSVYATISKSLLIALITIISLTSYGQTTLYNQDFEVDLAGYSHTPSQLPSADPGDQYFSRAMPSDGAIYESGGPYTNVTGDYLFVGSNPKTINSGNPGEIIFDQINISGFSNIVFSADFGGVPNDWDATDLLSVEYSLDGGTFVQLYSFASPVTNDPLELQGNAAGGGNTPNGTVLTYALQTITSEAIGTGSTLDLKIICDSGANYEAFGVDNITVTGIAAGGPPTVSFAVESADVPEEVGTYDICLTIVNPDISISTMATVSLTPDGTATNGTDINTYTDQTVTFPAGDNTPQCVTITVVDDTEIDENETLVFEISSVFGGIAGSQDTTTLTIIDNDKLTCAEPAWNVVSPNDNEEWTPITGGFEANGFCGGGCMQDVETWLIYGPLDMTGVGLLELAFTGAEGFGITDLNVQYSSEEGANACPNEVTWTSVGMVTASGDYTFDFSAATGTDVYIGIEYSDDGADGYSAWDLTDFALFADVCPTVGTFVTPMVDAGEGVIQCGIADVMLNATGDGMWSGGLGTFSDANSPTATYTPNPAEEGSIVTLTYTLNLAACTGFSDDVDLAFFEEPGDTEFSYGAIDICPGSGILSVMHTTGVDGTYTVTMGDETMIDLDPMNGDINLLNTSDGTYEITNTITGGGNLIISGVIDGPLTGGQPKAIEFYALADIPDLSIYGFGSANNGNGGGVIEFTFPAEAIAAGTYVYLTDSNTDFNTFFGFNANYVDGAAAINGDDALELYCNGSVIDVFGDINMDGSGEPWDYLDGWAYRVDNTGLNVGTFVVGDFSYSGTNALDGESSNGTATTPFPIGTFTTDQMGICPNSITSVTITIGDSEGPEVDCPSDIGVQLEPGECEELVFFDIPFMDNCGTIDAEMSQAINEALVNTALDCQFNTSNHLRYFENGLPVPVEISQVSFGIFNSGTTETVTVNVYSIMPGSAFEYGNMTLQGTTEYAVPAGMNNVILTAMLEATIPVGMDYVLELKANNTTNFVIGYNNLGETESTYIAGNPPLPCVSLEPVDIDVLGFGAFAVILFSNAEGGPTIEQTQGLPSGSYFPLGTTTNTFIVTDVNGNTTECTFDVNMVEFSNGVTGALTCNDNVNISLDQDCEVILGADMLLEGDQYGCYDDYIISVSGGVAGNVITEPGTYTVTITDPDTGNSCWSTINVEDKRPPTIEECACPVGGSEVVTPFVGSLDATDPIWTRPFVAGGACNPSGAGVDIPYDTYNFSLDMNAPLGAEVVSFSAPSGDSFLCLYEDTFDPTDPCGNLVITNDDGGVGLLSQFDVVLNSGVNYILVVTTFNNNGNDFGDYVVEITSDATLLELAEECNFRCVDIEYIMGSDDLTPNPTITSCSDYEAYFTDELTVDDNGNQIILRTWLAVNGNGSSTCTQQFNIAPIAIGELTLPISPVILSCNDGTSPEDIVTIFDNPLTQDNPNTSYVENNEGYVYAYPTYLINGHPQKVDNQVCDVYAAYTDQELDACEEGCNGNKKVIRTWTLVDWNTLEIETYIQTIKAVDTDAPTLITQDVTVSTDAWGCEATFPAPLPWELHDNCDSYPEYYISGPAGASIDGNFEDGYVISGVGKGTHTFNYIAYDCCGNEASYPFTVTVIDSTPPVVVAKQNVVISVTSGSTSGAGLAKLYAESIDNGSYDGCSDEVKLEIRRDEDNCDIRGNATYNADGHPQDGSPNPNSPSYDPDGGAYVKFCCADLDNATVDVNGDGELDPGYVKVWLRVWDDGDMDGIFGTAGDNYNEAWAYVKVEDKLAPAITCPPDVTLTCDMDYTDLNMTGSASAYGSCGGVDVEYNDIIINLNSCNEGFVRRRWSVVGRSDIFCDQTITMDDLDAPVNVSFSQVGDFTAANCPDMIALGEPTWIAGPCDVLGYTVETDTFFFEDGACYKLVNHWTVINWCDYEPNNPFWNGEGLWEHVQVIKVTDETQPVIEDCEDKMYAINDHSDSDDDGEVCEAKITLTNIATDPGSENCPTGWLKWQVLVDLWGDGTVDLEYSSFLPPFDTQFNDTNGNGIPDVYLAPTANGETVSVPLPDIAGSMSNHKVSWKVTDGCNNVTTCDTEFMVVDKKAPTPYMVSLSSAIMDEVCTVELWAIDFNIGSFDNCSAQEDLRYTFSDTPPEDDPNYDPALHSSSMTFDGDDVLNSPVEIQVYVWDEKGNADFAQVFLTLVDNHGCVDPPPPPMDECSCEPSEYTGWAVGTCNAEHDDAGAVGVIYNMTNTEDAPSEMDYAASITTIHPANWTIDQIGQVFGIAMDNSDNVFLAASDVYDTGFDSDPYGPGQIFKASAGNAFEAEPFVELPNTGGSLNGIGNIAYCSDNGMLYASNLEDGMIYRINASGAIMETYDPWTADDGSAGIAEVSEQVWGIGLNEEGDDKKLYFPRVTDGADGERAMYSITLNEDGSFPGTGTETLAFDGIMGVGLRITDIAFNTGGDQMIFAERGTRFVTGAHDSKVLRYDLVGGTWMMELKYFVGGWVTPQFPSIEVNPGENTGGGVDFGSTGVSANGIEGCDELVWSSMHYVQTTDGSLYYGMQGMNADGNNSSESATDPNFMTDIIIDYDGTYDNFDQKGDLGDVEIFKCGGSTSTKPMIAGMIETEGGLGVEEVAVSLGSLLPEYPITTMTDATGYFAFPENALNVDYQLTSSKDVDYLNGVSTLDLVKIQRHILGLEELNSPYKLIAADINGDTEVKAHDLVELRKLILGVITDLPTNESWRFVNRGQPMDMEIDLNDIDYSVEVDNLQADEMSNNFVAVKIGDVTEDAIANLADGATAVTRSNKTVSLSILNQEVEAGQEVSVGFTSEDFQEVFGYQFTMELSGLEFAGIESGAVAMKEGNVGVLSSNVVTMSYNSTNGVSASKDEDIFTVNFIAKTSGQLSNMIDITSKVTNSEAYVGESLEIRNVEIEMRGDVVEVETSELYQNEPNPFKAQTTIGYRLAAEGKVNFTVHDVTGKVLVNKSLQGTRGYNEITLKSSDLGISGVLYYTLESGEFTATKKMIILE